jgi:hypothetical protein
LSLLPDQTPNHRHPHHFRSRGVNSVVESVLWGVKAPIIFGILIQTMKEKDRITSDDGYKRDYP